MWQDEDMQSQLNWNFDAISSLLFTKEYIDAGFGIWDAGMSLSTTIFIFLFFCKSNLLC